MNAPLNPQSPSAALIADLAQADPLSTPERLQPLTASPQLLLWEEALGHAPLVPLAEGEGDEVDQADASPDDESKAQADELDAAPDAGGAAQLALDWGPWDGAASDGLSVYAPELSELGPDQDWNPSGDWAARPGLGGDELLLAGIQPMPLTPPATEAPPPAAAEPAPAPEAPAVVAPAPSEGTQTQASAPLDEPAQAGTPPVWLAGVALLGLGGGGGGGGTAPAQAPDPEPTVQFNLNVVPAMGELLSGHGLVAQAFRADGSALASRVVPLADGSFTLNVLEAYSGVVLLRLVDTNADVDYADVGTGAPADWGADLRAVTSISGSGSTSLVVSPLTELAVRELLGDSGGDAGGSPTAVGSDVTAAQAAAVNAAVAAAFGVSGDLVTDAPVSVDDPAFAQAGAVAQAYGFALAAISGMQANTEATLANTLSTLSQGLSVNGSSATLSASAIEALVAGAATADAVAGNASGAADALTETTTQFTMTVVPAMGQITRTDGLVLEAFKADGSVLNGRALFDSDGRATFYATEAYAGPVLLRLKDTDAEADYFDEATGQTQDLSTDLRAMLHVNGSDAVTVALNPLTELAVRKWLGDAGGDGGTAGATLGSATSEAQVQTANQAVAQAFGLSADLLTDVPVTVDHPAFAQGGAEAQAYGQVLAAISGMEAKASTTTTVVLDQLAQALSLTAGAASLSEQAIEDVILGAALADAQSSNATGSAAALNAVLDNQGPAVTAVVISPMGSLPLARGEGIDVQVQFNDEVFVDTAGGVPSLPLNLTLSTGDRVLNAEYIGGSGTSSLQFRHVIDLDAVFDPAVAVRVDANALGANGASLSDAVGNVATLDHAAASAASPYGVDTIAPTVSQIGLSDAQGMQAGLLNTGDTVTVTVGLSEATVVDTTAGAPSLMVDVGEDSVVATFAGLSAARTEAYFTLSIGAGQLDVDGISIAANALRLGDAQWTDVAGNPLTLSSAAVAPNATYLVDAIGPAAPTRPDLASADDTGVSNTDNISARTAGLSWSGVAEAKSQVIVFNDLNGDGEFDANEELTRVQASDVGAWAADVDLSEGAHAIHAIAIDEAGNLGVAASAAAEALIDNTAPTLKAFSSPAVAGAYAAGDSITLVATASEDLAAGGRIVATLASGEQVVLMALGDGPLLSGSYRIGDTAYSGDLFVTAYSDVPGVAVKDLAGKALATVAMDQVTNVPAASVIVDTVEPQVLSAAVVSATGARGDWLNAGDVLTIDVRMSEVVFLGSSALPTLALGLTQTGADSSGQATYLSGSGSDTLRFAYTVAEGDQARDGLALAANGLQLNLATLRDAAGNDANISHPDVAANPGFKIETQAPVIIDVSLPDQAMVVGDTVTLTLSVSDDGGVPYAQLNGQVAGFEVGGLTRVDATTYTASFTVAEGGGDVAADADIPVSLRLQDAAGNDSALYRTAVANAADGIDANTPTLKGVQLASAEADVVNNTLTEGDDLVVALSFSESVFVQGAPTFPVAQGGELVSLAYLGGSGSSTLRFGRSVLPGETDVDGISFVANALLLNGGRITDAAGMDATLSHAALSSGGYIVDTTAPVVTAFYTDVSKGEYKAGEQISVFAAMSEPVTAASELQVVLNTGATITLRPMDGDPSTLAGTAIVREGQNVDALRVSSIVVAGVDDLGGNVIIEGDMPEGNLPDSQDHQAVDGDLTIDTTPPETPARMALAAANDSGTDASAATYSDAITSQTQALLLSTVVEAGSTVRLYDGSQLLNTQVSADGQWSHRVDLSEGAHDMRVTSTDLAGNTSAASPSLNLVVDTTAPVVQTMSVVPGDGAVGSRLNAGDTVSVDVGFSEATWVHGGSPWLDVDVAGQSLRLSYESGSGSSSLRFSGEVPAGVDDVDGISVLANALSANGAQITDTAGNAASLAHGSALIGGDPVIVDNTAPNVSGVALAGRDASTGNDLLVWQDQVYVDVSFSEAVQVAAGAQPSLALDVGGTAVTATYQSGSGSDTLRFSYSVAAGLVDDDGISVPSGALQLAAAAELSDLAGNALGSATYAGLANNANYRVDATPPTVLGIDFLSATGMTDGFINAGDSMTWRVRLSEAVNISGTPKLVLDVGGHAVDATYVPGSGTQNLNFTANFQAGHEDLDGVSIAANALQAGGGSLTDGQGNAVDLSHAALAPLVDYPVDSLNPHVTAITSVTEDGWYKAGTEINISAVFNEALAADGGVITAVLNTGESVILNQWDQDNTLSGTYVVGASSNSVDLAVTKITIDTAPQDLAGNAMTEAGETHQLALTNLDVNRAIVVDTIAPLAPSKPDLDTFSDTGLGNADNHTKIAVNTSVSGTAEAGAKITLVDEDPDTLSRTLLGETQADENGHWSFVFTEGLDDGSYDIRASATDRAGNEGPFSEALRISIDTIKPTVTGISIPDAPMKVGDVVVATIGVEDDQGDPFNFYNVQGTVNGFALGNLTRVNATTYNATFTVTEGGNDVAAGGSIAVEGLTVDDSAGNRSDVVATAIAQASDAIDANSPKVTDLAISGSDGSRNDFLNAGDVVYVTATLGEATVVAGVPQLQLSLDSGVVLADYRADLSDATHAVFAYTIVDGNDADGIAIPANPFVLSGGAVMADAAGNAVTLSHNGVVANASYLVDTVAPTQPTLDLAAGDDLGVSDSDDETKQDTGLSLSGTAEAGSVVTLYSDTNGNGELDLNTDTVWADDLVADAAGRWSHDLSLAEGQHDLRVLATDAAGNNSVSSSAVNLVVDTTAPTVTAVALGDSVGLLNGFLNAGDQARVVLSLSEAVVVNAEGGRPSIDLDIGGQTVQAEYLSGSGSNSLVFSYTVVNTQNDGDGLSVLANSLRVNGGLITDVAGNDAVLSHGAITDDASQKVDTSAPAAAPVAVLDGVDDSGSSDLDAITSQTSGLSLSSSGEEGATVELFADRNGNGLVDSGELLGSTTIAGGAWAVDAALSEGVHRVRAILMDAAGNRSLASEALNVTVDTTAPLQPSALTLVSDSDSGRSSVDGVTHQKSGLTFKLNAEAGASVELFEGSTPLAFTVVDGNLLRLDVDLEEGEHVLYARVTDVAGNVSVDGVLSPITVDVTPPAQPSAINLAAADDLGISDSDNLTKQSAGLTLSGSAEADASVEVYDDLNGDGVLQTSERLGTALASNGTWSFDVSLTATTHRIQVVAKDAAGNASPASEVLALTVDITEPTYTSLRSWDVTGAAGYSAGDVLRLVFSEPIQVDALRVSDLQLDNGHSLGSGAILQAQNPLGGVADTVWVTLGEAPTLSGGDILSIGGSKIVDAAGNAASQTLEMLVPAAQAGSMQLATTAAAETLAGTSADEHFVAVGYTVAGQYASSDAVLGRGAVITAITRDNNLTTLNLGDSFLGDDGFDVLTIYGTASLEAGINLSGIERFQIYGDVTMTESQLSQLAALGGAIDGGEQGILRIVDDGSDVDLSGLRITRLAQLDVGADVKATLAQAQLGHIGAISTATSNAQIQAAEGALEWAGVTVYGAADALNSAGENLGALTEQADVIDGGSVLQTVQASQTAANALLSAGLAAYQTPVVEATDFDAILSGAPGVDHTLVAFGDARHWLVGDGLSDTLIAGDGGDLLWGGTELQQNSSVSNRLVGGDGNDVVVSGSNNDQITTGAGVDYIDAGAGADTIRAGAGNDYIRTGTGTDTIQFEASVAANGVDLFDNGVVGDVFDFSAVKDGGGFLGLDTLGSDSVWTTSLAGLSNLGSHDAAFIVLTDSNIGDEAALKAALDQTAFDTVDKESPRVVLWSSGATMVDMAFVGNNDSLDDNSVSVETFAHLMMTTTLTHSTFLNELNDAHFVV